MNDFLEKQSFLKQHSSIIECEGTEKQPSSIPEYNQGSNIHDNQEVPIMTNQKDRSFIPLTKLINKFQGCFPFVLLALSKYTYSHKTGILVFVAFYCTIYHANSRLMKLVSEPSSKNSLKLSLQALWNCFYLLVNLFLLNLAFPEENLYKILYFSNNGVHSSDLWSLLWLIILTNLIIKTISIIFKSMVTSFKSTFLSITNKGFLYQLIELLSNYYIGLALFMPWVQFLLDNKEEQFWLSYLLIGIYFIFKCKFFYSDVKQHYKLIKSSRYKKYGTPITDINLINGYINCNLCHDKFQSPFLLPCNHFYCEECINSWFNFNRVCPICQVQIIENNLWKDGSTSISLQLF